MLTHLIVDGVALALVYTLLTSGLVLILSVTGILYIAYGSLYMIGAFTLWSGIALLKLPFVLSLSIAIIVAAALALASYQFIIQHVLRRPKPLMAILVIVIALMMILDQSGIMVFGSVAKGLPSIIPGTVSIIGVNIPLEKLIVMAVALVIALSLFYVYEKTDVGRVMRAVSFDPETASLQGVNTHVVHLVALGIGGALAGIAGGIMAPVYGVYPSMGSDVIFVVLLIAMLGGMDSMAGAVCAAFICGMAQSAGQFFIGGLYQVLIFVIAGIIIYLRPGGLLGSGIQLKV